MGTMAEAAREARARRAAARVGCRIVKSRREASLGTYMILDDQTNVLLAGDRWTGGYGLSLEDVEQWLSEAAD